MVIDISNGISRPLSKNEVFFVDANILVFMYGPNPSVTARNKGGIYANFIQHLKRNGCILKISTLNLQEVFHVIERQHFELFRRVNPANKNITLKVYRALSAERIKLERFQQAALRSICGFCKVSPETVKAKDISGFIISYHSHRYDPIDYVFAEHRSPCNFITDDHDFINDPALTVYTVR